MAQGERTCCWARSPHWSHWDVHGRIKLGNKLINKLIRKTKPDKNGDAQYVETIFNDTEKVGLKLKINPGGTKTFFFQTWSKDKGGVERGKDYNHSGFCDLVISDLLGLKPNIDGSIKIQPMIPENWDWFCIERLLINGNEVRMVWDKYGDRYNIGKGLMVFINNKLVNKSLKIQNMVINST